MSVATIWAQEGGCAFGSPVDDLSSGVSGDVFGRDLGDVDPFGHDSIDKDCEWEDIGCLEDDIDEATKWPVPKRNVKSPTEDFEGTKENKKNNNRKSVRSSSQTRKTNSNTSGIGDSNHSSIAGSNHSSIGGSNHSSIGGSNHSSIGGSSHRSSPGNGQLANSGHFRASRGSNHLQGLRHPRSNSRRRRRMSLDSSTPKESQEGPSAGQPPLSSALQRRLEGRRESLQHQKLPPARDSGFTQQSEQVPSDLNAGNSDPFKMGGMFSAFAGEDDLKECASSQHNKVTALNEGFANFADKSGFADFYTKDLQECQRKSISRPPRPKSSPSKHPSLTGDDSKQQQRVRAGRSSFRRHSLGSSTQSDVPATCRDEKSGSSHAQGSVGNRARSSKRRVRSDSETQQKISNTTMHKLAQIYST